MKLTCSCGQSHYIFDWPPATIEEGGKKMMERHIFCPCQIEVVVRTAPKEEPDYEGPEDDKPKIVSQEHLVKMLGLTPAPEVKRVIEDKTPRQKTGLLMVNLSSEDARVLKESLAHYGNVFKAAPPVSTHGDKGDKNSGPPPQYEDMHAKEREAFLVLSEKVYGGDFMIENIEEARMVRCAFSDRNVRRLYPTKEMDYDDEPNVISVKAVKALRDRILTDLEKLNA